MAYFDRLVAETLRPAPRLHSVAALPYARTELESPDAAAPALDMSAIARTADEDQTLDVPRRPTPSHSERARMLSPAAALSAEQASEPTGETLRGTSTAERSPAGTPSPARPLTVVTRTASEQPREAGSLAGIPRSDDSRAASKPPAAHSSQPATRGELRPAVQTHAAASRAVVVARAPEDATPGPDVHIHIGRIELTAVTPPAAPRRVPKQARTPMPLDEYLQRRSGKAQ